MDFSKDRELIIVILFAIIAVLIVHGTLSQYKGLPSPLYGGDYYYQLGQIYHMYQAPFLEWFGSSNGIGERPVYMVTYGVLVAIFGKVLGLDPIKAIIDFNYILIPACFVVFFLLGRKISGSGIIGLIVTLIFVNIANFPIFKYTDFTHMLLFPAFLYALYLFFREQNLKNSVLLGIMYGVVALSHSTGFFVTSFLIAALFVYKAYGEYRGKKFAFSKETLGGYKYHAVAFLVGFLMAQAFWFAPIFVYHGSASLETQVWTQPDLAVQQVMVSETVNYVSSLFFNLASPIGLVMSLLLIYSVYLVYRKEAENPDFLVLVFGAVLLLNFSYIITVPLLDTHLIPGYVFPMYTYTSAILFSTIGMKKLLGAKYRNYAVAALLAVALYSQYAALEAKKTDQWMAAGIAGISEFHLAVQEGVMENTEVDDVILTTNENGFAINALTGRKLVASRRSHNDPFVQDFDGLEMDAAVMLYGKNLEKRKGLLKEYGVDYVYWDFYWAHGEFSFDDQGRVTGLFDPLLVLDTPGNRAYLDENGVKYAAFTGWMDPAIKGPNIRMYQLLVVVPDNYDVSGKGPWDDGIDPYLEKVWSYQAEGQDVAVLYQVRVP